MSDYISRDVAIIEFMDNDIDHIQAPNGKEAVQILSDIPAADVVPVVRCGQCGYWHSDDGDYGYCYAKEGQGFGHAWGKNDFCSYGERREE